MRTLYNGCSRGEDVKYLQYLLIQNGYDVAMDGSFGPLTEKAVKQYQKAHNLKDDGSVGPKTRKVMGLTDFMVWILDPKEYELWTAGTKYGSESYPLKTLETWCREENADMTWNLAFFNRSDGGKKKDQYGVIKGRTITYVKSKGYDVGYGGTKERLWFDSKNGFAGYKLAVKNGVRKSVSTSGKRARNANGQLKDGRFFVVQSVNKQTEYAIVSHMVTNYKVDTMFIQDAGGSTGFYYKKKDALIACEREGSNGRPVATVVCARKK